jgi:hypothetical protein
MSRFSWTARFATTGRLLLTWCCSIQRLTCFRKHTILALTKHGAAAGELVSEDPELQRLAAKYGFCTINPTNGSGGRPHRPTRRRRYRPLGRCP